MIHPKVVNDTVKFPDTGSEGSWKVGQTLKIGKIINSKGESVSSLTLEPQGIAHLISSTCVYLPSDVCGLAHVLTRMCNRGLLTLDIGVVDPGWNNHLSTPVLNFSSERRLLQVGDPFIRITYHNVTHARGAEKGTHYRNEPSTEYDREIKARAVGEFGKSFLNINRLVGKASKKETARFREAMLRYIPIGAFSLAFFALMVTIGLATAVHFLGRSQNETLRHLNARISSLEADLRDAQQTVSAPETEASQDETSSVTPPSGARTQ